MVKEKKELCLDFMNSNACLVTKGKTLRCYSIVPAKRTFRGLELGTPLNKNYDTKILRQLIDKNYIVRSNQKGEEMLFFSNPYLVHSIEKLKEGFNDSGFGLTNKHWTNVHPLGSKKDFNLKEISFNYAEMFKSENGLVLPKSLFFNRCFEGINKSGLLFIDLFIFENRVIFTINLETKTIKVFEKLGIKEVSKLTNENTLSNPKISEIDKYYFNSLETFRQLLDSGVSLNFEETLNDYYESSYKIVALNKNMVLVNVNLEIWGVAGENSQTSRTKEMITTEQLFEFLKSRKYGTKHIELSFKKSVIQAASELSEEMY